MSKRVIAIIVLILLTLGGLLFSAEEMPAEVDELSGIEFILGLLALSTVFWLPVVGALVIIALANRLLTWRR